MPDQPAPPPVPVGPTPLGLQIAHPDQAKILRKIMRFRTKPKTQKPRTHRRKKTSEWSHNLQYY
jgi:hypothetical protein